MKWAAAEGKTTAAVNVVVTDPSYIEAQNFQVYNFYNFVFTHQFSDKLTYVLDAGNGEKALAVAEQCTEPIDVVVTDVMMPGMNGREFADEILRAHPGLGVVFMSGYTDETVSQRGLVDSTRTFLQKPFTGDQLLRAIRDLIPARAAA